MASYVAAYRIGMLVSTAGVLFLVTGFEDFGFVKSAAWTWGYLAMAALVVIGIVTTIVATEPDKKLATNPNSPPRSRRILGRGVAMPLLRG